MTADQNQWGTPWIEPANCNNSQLLLLTCIYGFCLYQSSNLISNGSELLLLIPAVAGLVGSIVLPILGAVPDSMMTLMSGNSQAEIGVGVGVLAGSSVFLLCIPWFIAVVFGRVPLKEDGSADYSKRSQTSLFWESGIALGPSIPKNAKIMLATTLLYLVIQIPATHDEGKEPHDLLAQAKDENRYALIGMFLCCAAFAGYLVYCYKDANEDKVLAAVIEGIKNRTISLPAALHFAIESAHDNKALLSRDEKYLKTILKPFFKRYDNTAPFGSVDEKEFEMCCSDLGIHKPAQRQHLWKSIGKTGNEIDLDQFANAIFKWASDAEHHETLKNIVKAQSASNLPGNDEEEEEEEEVPEDLADLSPAEQKKAIIFRSLWMMGLGTAVVVVVSDPFVDVLSEIGVRAGIPGFYIGFVLAPVASNASELLAAYNYAGKKTAKSITTSLSTLIGAACMNNTFCLAIFLALIYFKEFAWTFQAEVASVLAVQIVVGIVACVKTTHTTTTGLVILLCYPLCVFLVWFLENVLGWD